MDFLYACKYSKDLLSYQRNQKLSYDLAVPQQPCVNFQLAWLGLDCSCRLLRRADIIMGAQSVMENTSQWNPIGAAPTELEVSVNNHKAAKAARSSGILPAPWRTDIWLGEDFSVRIWHHVCHVVSKVIEVWDAWYVWLLRVLDTQDQTEFGGLLPTFQFSSNLNLELLETTADGIG